MAKFYVAASWRNEHQPGVVLLLRALGQEVYDYRNPPEACGFHWEDINPDYENWSEEQFRKALEHPLAVKAFKSDYVAMHWADACVFIMPSGHSGHLEAGWAVGAGKPTAIILDGGRPELMYAMADKLIINEAELISWVTEIATQFNGGNSHGR